MKIGDIVRAKRSHSLHCSHFVYSFATVVSMNPFVLKSTQGDMTWTKEKPENFEVRFCCG